MGGGRVAIFGGGAAGLSCALWLRHLGFAPLVVEQGPALGGQLLQVRRANRWVLGLPGKTGPELAALYGCHVLGEGVEVRLGARPLAVAPDAGGFRLLLREGGGPLPVRALVVATGQRVNAEPLLQSIPGARLLHEAGLFSFFPLDHLDRPEACEGLRVAVVGGGDNAHCTAKDLAGRAVLTHLLVRSRPKAQPAIRAEVEELARQGRIVEHQGAAIAGFRQGPGGIAIDLGGRVVEVDRVFGRTGFAPNTEFLTELGPLAGLARDGRGYLRVDGWQRTSLPFVYAAGDVAGPPVPAVVTAVAAGAVAARAAAQDLESPA